jgi:hypothetical protein
VKAVLVAGARVPAVAVSVYPAPALLMLRSEKFATPLVGVAVVVPESVPPPGLVPIATVIVLVAVLTVLSSTSRTVTLNVGSVPPENVGPGCALNTSLVAGPAFTSKMLLTIEDRPVAVARSAYPEAALVIERLENVATPFTAETVVTPSRVAPLPGLFAIERKTLFVALSTVFPARSCTATLNVGIVPTAVVLTGCAVNASLEGTATGLVVSPQAMTSSGAAVRRTRENRDAEADVRVTDPPLPIGSPSCFALAPKSNASQKDVATPMTD